MLAGRVPSRGAFACPFGLERAVFQFQVVAFRQGAAGITAFPSLETGMAKARFGGDLGAGLAALDSVLDVVFAEDLAGVLFGNGLGVKFPGGEAAAVDGVGSVGGAGRRAEGRR